MAFQNVDFIRQPLKDVLASISYKRNDTKHGKSKNPKLIIGIPAALATAAKVKEAESFALQIGSGEHAGKARIVRSAKGCPAKAFKGAATFRFGFVPMLGTDAAEREMVDVRLIEGGFEIDLPPWFKADDKAGGEKRTRG